MTPFEEIHTELKKKGFTLMLLWQEYKEKNPGGYQYTQFCDRYRNWAKTRGIYTYSRPASTQRTYPFPRTGRRGS